MISSQLVLAFAGTAWSQGDGLSTTLSVTIDRGQDIGQNFGSLFEVTTEDGSLTIGAGFQNSYNTRSRGDRHVVQFFVRPASGERAMAAEQLSRPNGLCGTYLYSRDDVVYSTYGPVKAWSPGGREWEPVESIGGTEETMRVGNGVLSFGDSRVSYDGRTILDPPALGSYQLFFYANGHLCFYHVNRKDGPYRPYQDDAEGFSRLYACPWAPGAGAVDLAKAVTHTLPIVGETTFAWGQLGNQVVTGSNVGGFYIFQNGAWRMLLAPQLGVSYQLYSSMAYGNKLVMGQYPTGRLFEYDGEKITDIPGWPPKLDGVVGHAREAQTTAIYGGDLFVGVWPWGELWSYNPEGEAWSFERRMFDHPQLSDKITHPYDVENTGHDVSNAWGQRVTSLVPVGTDLFVSTSAKAPYAWEPEKAPFLAPEKWKSYGAVYRLTMPGHLGAPVKWTEGPTKLTFTIRGTEMSISQDGQQIATTTISGPLAEKLAKTRNLKPASWGGGIYGPFAGEKIEGLVAE